MFVLLATRFNSLAPSSLSLVFSNIDFTTVTPSLVILGSPFSYSSAILRPPGPKVKHAVFDSRLIPSTSGLLESAPNSGIIDLKVGLNLTLVGFLF